MSQINANYNSHKDCYLTDELLERYNETSPDYLDLKGLLNIPVFVFGQEMTGGKFNKVFDGAIYLGAGRTATTSFVMEKSENDFPIVFSTGQNVHSAYRVKGEVYLVSAKTMLTLDLLNGNNEMTKREKKFVHLSDQTIDKASFRPSLKCWTYLADFDFWEDKRTIRVQPKDLGVSKMYEWSNDFQFEIPDFLKRPF